MQLKDDRTRQWRIKCRFDSCHSDHRNSLRSGLNAHFYGNFFLPFRPFGVYLVLIDVKKGPADKQPAGPLFLYSFFPNCLTSWLP